MLLELSQVCNIVNIKYRWNIRLWLTATLDNTRPAALSTVAGIIRTVAYKAGIREVSENYKDRYNIKIAHGFRKFFNTILAISEQKMED